jgi:hypothetical protein
MVSDPIIGTYQLKLDDMLELMSRGQEWYNLAGVKTGRVKMLLQWKPVALKGALGGSGGYVTPIGVMRLHFQNARDLRNLETLGKSDPYIRAMLSGVMKGRTVTWKNNLNPDFDEVLYVPVHSTREKLSLEVMDEEKIGKDRLLGMIELAVSDYAHQDDNGEYLVNDTKKSLSQGLRLGATGSAKGTLNFTASFFPTLNVIDPEDEEKEDKSNLASLDPVKEPPTPTLEVRPQGHTRSDTAGTIGSLKSNPAAAEMRQQLAANEDNQDDGLPIKKEVPKVRIGAEDLSNYGKSDPCRIFVRELSHPQNLVCSSSISSKVTLPLPEVISKSSWMTCFSLPTPRPRLAQSTTNSTKPVMPWFANSICQGSHFALLKRLIPRGMMTTINTSKPSSLDRLWMFSSLHCTHRPSSHSRTAMDVIAVSPSA